MVFRASFQAPGQLLDTTLAPDSFARATRAATTISGITRRQHQVLELMAAGQMNKQIAHLLNLSEKTVKMHRKLLLDALGVRSSAAAIRLFVEASFLMTALSPDTGVDPESAHSNLLN
jgi:DNA-binding NarL/FixJ family response regulator